MALMYKRNPVLLLVDDDETVLLAICLRDLALAAGDLFDLQRHAEEVGLRLFVVESVTVDSLGWLEEEIVWAAHRRDEAATAPRSVRGLLAKGVCYMDHLSLDLRIADGLTDGVNEGEPFGTLTPEAMAQRLRFRLADYDRQREIPVYRQGGEASHGQALLFAASIAGPGRSLSRMYGRSLAWEIERYPTPSTWRTRTRYRSPCSSRSTTATRR